MPARTLPTPGLFDPQNFPGEAIDRASANFRLTIIPKGQTTPVPAPELEELVHTFEIEEDDKMCTSMKVTFDNPEFVLSRQDSLLQPGTILLLETGYGQRLTGKERAVEIVRMIPDYPSGEGGSKPTFTVEGYDGRQRLLDANTLSDRGIDSQEKTQLYGKLGGTFKKKTDTFIITDIARQFGFAAEIDYRLSDAQKPRTRIKKKDQSWWDFILKLGQKNNAEVWVDYSYQFRKWHIHFVKKDPFTKPGMRLAYSSDGGDDGNALLSFNPRLDSVGQQTSIQVLHFDKRKKRNRIEYVTDRPAGQTFDEFQAAVMKLRVSGKTQYIFSDKPFKDKKAAQRFAEEYVRRNREDYITANGMTVGIDVLRPRQVHQIIIGDERFDGNYYFTQVRHSYARDEIYKCSFVAFKVPTRFVVPKTIPVRRVVNLNPDGFIEGVPTPDRFKPSVDYGGAGTIQ